MFHRVWQTFHQKTVPKTSYNLDTFFAPGVLASRVRRRYRTAAGTGEGHMPATQVVIHKRQDLSC
jgi:hypothetical protein